MITAVNLSEERLLSLLDTATDAGMVLWFDMSIENGRMNGAPERDLETFLRYRNSPNPEQRREFLKNYFRRAFREGWAHELLGLSEGPLIT